MDLDTAMTQLTARLATINGLRTEDFPPANIASLVPLGWLRLPEGIDYDNTAGRDTDVMKLTAVVAVGRPNERTTRQRIVAYAAGSGASSVKAALETPAPGETNLAFGGCRVERCEFTLIAVGGVDYAAAEFTIDLHGSGA